VISCNRFDELHLASQDAPLSGTDRTEFEVHLAACPACVRRVAGYVTVVGLLQGLDAADKAREPAPLPEELVRRVLAARRAEPGASRARHAG
jgi:anti-sigma factor RsiW